MVDHAVLTMCSCPQSVSGVQCRTIEKHSSSILASFPLFRSVAVIRQTLCWLFTLLQSNHLSHLQSHSLINFVIGSFTVWMCAWTSRTAVDDRYKRSKSTPPSPLFKWTLGVFVCLFPRSAPFITASDCHHWNRVSLDLHFLLLLCSLEGNLIRRMCSSHALKTRQWTVCMCWKPTPINA